jgi:DNA-binding LytR/AlgR family response regulator
MSTLVRQVLIVEDDDASLNILTHYLSHLPFFAEPVFCRNVPEAMAAVAKQAFDLILLDMHLPGLSGIDFLKTLSGRYPVVITTSNPDFAVESYDLNVADYLLKPFTLQRFLRAVGRATSVHLSPNALAEPTAVFLKIGRKVQRFDYDTIDYVEAYGIYSKVWSNGSVIVVNEAISALESLLPAQQFLRIHKSYIVNLNKMTSYDFRHVWIGSEKVPLGGASYRTQFQSYLNLLRRDSA